ncbi:MAG: hypothetical protein PHQ96_08125 [Candidatus Omnitrophica bacterium]|nr:hypothetical protein [Candidatus Omnitrophota bacterium]
MRILKLTFNVILAVLILFASFCIFRVFYERRTLQKVIERLSADSRIAEVLVTKANLDTFTGKTYTTIKFLEYDSRQHPLSPKYFTFSGNIIQFQSMVIRFDDFYIKSGHSFKGKSAYLFMKAFCLAQDKAEIFEISKINEVPLGYTVSGAANYFEKKLWLRFWRYALDPKASKMVGVKNAQIEAPGTKFIPGLLYTIKIEHDGGMRIDSEKLPEIINGEKINF